MTYQLSVLLAVFYLGYGFDYFGLLNVSARGYPSTVFTVLVAVAIGAARWIRRFIPAEQCRARLLWQRVAIAGAAATTFQVWFGLPEFGLDGDEVLRFAMARAIQIVGLPFDLGWFIAGAKEMQQSYLFSEWTAALIGSGLRDVIPLEHLYYSLLPVAVRSALVVCAWELADRMRGQSGSLTAYDGRTALGDALIAGLCLFGPTPYFGGAWNTLTRQSVLGFLLMLLAYRIVFDLLEDCRHDTSGGNPRLWRVQAVLLGALMCTLVATKLLFATVCWGALMGVSALLLIRSRRKVVALHLILTVVAGVVSLGMFPTRAPEGSWVVMLPQLASSSFVPALTNVYLSTAISLGAVAIPVFLLASWLSGRDYVRHATPWLAGALLVFLTGLLPGLFLKYSGNTGNAESYWLVAAWFGLLILGLAAIAGARTRRAITVVTAYLIVSFAHSSALEVEAASAYRKYYDSRRSASAVCREVNGWIVEHDPDRDRTFAIAHEWQGKTVFEIAGYCAAPSVVSTSPYADLQTLPEWRDANAANSQMTSAADISAIVREYKARTGLDGVFVIRRRNNPLPMPQHRMLASTDDYIVYGPL